MMMCTNAIRILFAICFIGRTSPCSFNPDCDCDQDQTVICSNCTTFPVFSPTFEVIKSIIISGNFTYIPAKAFYNFHGYPIAEISLFGSRNMDSAASAMPLVVNESAFVMLGYDGLASVTFQYFNMSNGIPSAALAGVRVTGIFFEECWIKSIEDNAFNSFLVNSISIINCNVPTIQPLAFNGITFFPLVDIPSTGLYITENSFTDISSAFQSVSATSIVLQQNMIMTIDDFAFCNCNTVAGCNNSVLQSLSFKDNPITSISNNAFANLPSLIELEFIGMNLTSVPVAALAQVASSLKSLNLAGNNIQNIGVNSFLNFKKLTDFIISDNPITSIAPGAFNGISRLSILFFTDLDQLHSVDALIGYGMAILYGIIFQDCPNLNNLTLSDYSKLPYRLNEISLSPGDDVREISSEFQYWFSSNPNTFIDVTGNENFYCTSDIQWMAKYALCKPYQIRNANLSHCNGTSTSLSTYLAAFKPTCA